MPSIIISKDIAISFDDPKHRNNHQTMDIHQDQEAHPPPTVTVDDVEREDDDDDDFFDPCDCMSIASSSDLEDNKNMSLSLPPHPRRPLIFSRNQTSSISSSQCDSYDDAVEDFFSDGSVSNSSPSFRANFSKELKAFRLSFIEEAERRKKAEKDLFQMHAQWQRLTACLSQVGLSFPEIQYSGNARLQLDPAALCQEIIVTRFVAEAIERALSRAETEAIIEAIIDSKNHEISRLHDRLQYYEAVNREMSQRNREAVEFSRQQRSWRKRRRNLIWCCVGLSITFGASLLAYSYFPSFVRHNLPCSSPDVPATSTSCSGTTES